MSRLEESLETKDMKNQMTNYTKEFLLQSSVQNLSILLLVVENLVKKC